MIEKNLPMSWSSITTPPPLSEKDIHVWRFRLENNGNFERFTKLLAEDESRRASRFLFDRHREHFVIGRAIARIILGWYIDRRPELIEYAYDNLGKPRFAHVELNAQLRFNLSNSHDLGLLAVTRSTEVGVDLERIREMNDMLGLAKRYFAEEETDRLFGLPASKQASAFFRLWTRKEAYLKAVGKGLTCPLREVHVSLHDSPEACRIVDINGDQTEAAKWTLANLDPNPEFKSALAIKRLGNRILKYSFELERHYP